MMKILNIVERAGLWLASLATQYRLRRITSQAVKMQRNQSLVNAHTLRDVYLESMRRAHIRRAKKDLTAAFENDVFKKENLLKVKEGKKNG